MAVQDVNVVNDVTVDLKPGKALPTPDQPLWIAIRNRTEAIGFTRYAEFVYRVLCHSTKLPRDACNGEDYDHPGPEKFLTPLQDRIDSSRSAPFHGVDAYNLLKAATYAFLTLECGVVIREPRFDGDRTDGQPHEATPEERDQLPATPDLPAATSYRELQLRLRTYLGQQPIVLPYVNRIVDALLPKDRRQERMPFCDELLQHRFTCPCLIELIWSYWHEEGMLVQSLNGISMRFQNRAVPGDRDQLARLTLMPLRPLNNLIWGYIQDEQNRLTVARRAYEYDHEYGLRLIGRAVPQIQSVDSRSKFLEGFHNLLRFTSSFYKQFDNKMVVADPFPVLNVLKEVHLTLAQGAHNQFGDLPWTARAEMLLQQWLLARPEMREFLGGRPMVPYREPWMGQVDAIKGMKGWTDVAITHFRDLAVFGEQLLLSIRYGDWTGVINPGQAQNWAIYWRPEVQGYLHAYRVVTGVDLESQADSTQPSERLRARLAQQMRPQ